MYTPRSFRVDDNDQLAAFMQRYSFCTLVTPDGDDMSISHLPVLIDYDSGQLVLSGHLASANPHANRLDQRPSTAIFHGPHSYISPAWYADSCEVPTWNYAAVHATGKALTFNDEQSLSALVDRMVEKYEQLHGAPWDRQLPNNYRRTQLRHITGFRIAVEKISGKYKLGQNRSQADQDKMLSHLADSSDDDSRALARFVENYRSKD